MPLAFGPTFVEGKVYRARKKQDGDDEKQALKEINAILSIKNRKSCDCEAQVHDLLENCLNCGRLACISEGPGKCFSCDTIIMSQEQRQRLSKYLDVQIANNPLPSSSGKPVTIFDPQYDQFSIDKKKHLSSSDKRQEQSELEQLQSKKYQRKLQLSIDIESMTADSVAVPEVEDYQAELKKLQISDHYCDSIFKYNLAQLVEEESKRNYNLEYKGSS